MLAVESGVVVEQKRAAELVVEQSWFCLAVELVVELVVSVVPEMILAEKV